MHVNLLGTAALAAILATATVAAQSGASQVPRSATAPAGAPVVTASDREFIAEMTMAGMAEVQLAQLTVEHAVDENVKAYGQTLLRDHTQANAGLAEIAKTLKVTPPKTLDRRHQELVQKLTKLQGTAAFDREYVSAMIESHRDVADQLRVHAGPLHLHTTERSPDATGGDAAAAATTPEPTRSAAVAGITGGDAGAGPVGTSGLEQGAPALREWAAKTLPVVEGHLQRAQELQKTVK